MKISKIVRRFCGVLQFLLLSAIFFFILVIALCPQKDVPQYLPWMVWIGGTAVVGLFLAEIILPALEEIEKISSGMEVFKYLLALKLSLCPKCRNQLDEVRSATLEGMVICICHQCGDEHYKFVPEARVLFSQDPDGDDDDDD